MPEAAVAAMVMGLPGRFPAIRRYHPKPLICHAPKQAVATGGAAPTPPWYPRLLTHCVVRPCGNNRWDSFRPYDEHNMWILEAQFKGTDLSPLTEVGRTMTEPLR